MTSTEEVPPLLDTVTCGALLSRLLRLVLCPERRDEFLGDLLEEAHLRLPATSKRQLSLWLWKQTLRSLPSLAGGRLARLPADVVAAVAGHRMWGHHAGPARAALVGGSRAAAGGLSLPLAISLSVHALLVLGGGAWLLSQVDEVDPARTARALWGALPDLVMADVDEPRLEARQADHPSPSRRSRPARRRADPAPAPAPAALISPTSSALTRSTTDGATATLTPSVPSLVTRASATDATPPAIGDGPAGPRATSLPPRVAEKRCLSCPLPRLERPRGWMVSGRDMLVRTCVSARGNVTSVDILRSLGSGIDREVLDTVSTWRLLPYRVDGRPVPFCYVTRFLFTTH